MAPPRLAAMQADSGLHALIGELLREQQSNGGGESNGAQIDSDEDESDEDESDEDESDEDAECETDDMNPETTETPAGQPTGDNNDDGDAVDAILEELFEDVMASIEDPVEQPADDDNDGENALDALFEAEFQGVVASCQSPDKQPADDDDDDEGAMDTLLEEEFENVMASVEAPVGQPTDDDNNDEDAMDALLDEEFELAVNKPEQPVKPSSTSSRGSQQQQTKAPSRATQRVSKSTKLVNRSTKQTSKGAKQTSKSKGQTSTSKRHQGSFEQTPEAKREQAMALYRRYSRPQLPGSASNVRRPAGESSRKREASNDLEIIDGQPRPKIQRTDTAATTQSESMRAEPARTESSESTTTPNGIDTNRDDLVRRVRHTVAGLDDTCPEPTREYNDKKRRNPRFDKEVNKGTLDDWQQQKALIGDSTSRLEQNEVSRAEWQRGQDVLKRQEDEKRRIAQEEKEEKEAEEAELRKKALEEEAQKKRRQREELERRQAQYPSRMNTHKTNMTQTGPMNGIAFNQGPGSRNSVPVPEQYGMHTLPGSSIHNQIDLTNDETVPMLQQPMQLHTGYMPQLHGMQPFGFNHGPPMMGCQQPGQSQLPFQPTRAPILPPASQQQWPVAGNSFMPPDAHVAAQQSQQAVMEERTRMIAVARARWSAMSPAERARCMPSIRQGWPQDTRTWT